MSTMNMNHTSLPFSQMTASQFNQNAANSPRLGSISPSNIANELFRGSGNGSLGAATPEALFMNNNGAGMSSSFSTAPAPAQPMGFHDLKTLLQGNQVKDTYASPMLQSLMNNQGGMSMPSSSSAPTPLGLVGSSGLLGNGAATTASQSNDLDTLKNTYLLQKQLMMQNQNPSMNLNTNTSLLSTSTGLTTGLCGQFPSATRSNPMPPLPSPHSLFNRRRRGGVIEPFPEKLHRLLLEVEAAGRSDVISFIAGGQAFAIHKPDIFFKEIVPLYFRQSRLSSFKRQLNLYGFELINTGASRGGYHHKLFRRDQADLCRKMRRVLASKSSSSSWKNDAKDNKNKDDSSSEEGKQR